MFCMKCGKQLPDDARFCTNCGAPVGVAPNAQATPEAQPAPEARVGADAATSDFGASTAGAAFTTNDIPTAENQPPKKKKKKKLGLILGIVIPVVLVLALAAVAVWFFLFRSNEPASAINAYVDNSGTGYICYDNGRVVKISGELSEAIMTPDCKKIIVVEEKGDVYWTDVKKSEKHKITQTSEEVWVEIDSVTNKYILIGVETENDTTEKMEYIRYDFETQKLVTVLSVSVGTDGSDNGDIQYDAVVSETYGADDIAVAIAKEGKISVLVPDSNKLKNIASYGDDEEIVLLGVSSDGESVVWTETKEGKYSVILYADGKEQTVTSGEPKGPTINSSNYETYLERYLQENFEKSGYTSEEAYAEYIIAKWSAEIYSSKVTDSEQYIIDKLVAYFSNSGDTPYFAVDISPKNNVIVITGADKTAFVVDGDIQTVKLPSDAAVDTVYTTNGLPVYKDSNASRADGYYVLVDEESDNLKSVYLIKFDDAERTKLISKVQNATFVEDKIFYQDKDGDFNAAVVDIKKAQLEDEQSIGSDIALLVGSETNSNYIYYLKNYDSKEGNADLYVYNFKEDDSDKIASDVGMNLEVSIDGTKVYYFVDITNDTEQYVSYGTLKVYDAKADDSDTIADDVITYSLTSNLSSDEIEPKAFWFEKYQNSTAESYNFNVCFYDGKKSSNVVKNLEY